MELTGIEGRVAFVTGGGQGIGRCIAETLRDLGARVAVGDLQAPTIEGVLGVECDVTDEHGVDASFAAVEKNIGLVDMLVLNAGVLSVTPLEETSPESWRQIIEVNLTGAFLCARRALPNMRARRYGRVVAIGSTGGKTGGAGGAGTIAAYAASKAGLMALAKSIAVEYASLGVTSNALAPAFIDTEMIQGLTGVTEKVPIGRLGTPQEVADMVAFLCSEHAAFVTGEVIDVNGGFFID